MTARPNTKRQTRTARPRAQLMSVSQSVSESKRPGKGTSVAVQAMSAHSDPLRKQPNGRAQEGCQTDERGGRCEMPNYRESWRLKAFLLRYPWRDLSYSPTSMLAFTTSALIVGTDGWIQYCVVTCQLFCSACSASVAANGTETAGAGPSSVFRILIPFSSSKS